MDDDMELGISQWLWWLSGTNKTWFLLTDVNECLNNTADCDDVTENCENVAGSYRCVCKEGYAPNTADNDTCEG